MTNKIRIALVGCGRISEKHFQAVKGLPDLQLVGVCDTNKELAEKKAHEQGCKAFTDYETMLVTLKPDIVSICTPNFLHPVQTILAAQKKINVITEKPMALTLKDARNMINACKKNNVHLFVIKQNRYNPPIQKLKEAIDKGRFGKIYLGSICVRWQRPQEYYDQDNWHGTLLKDGGTLLNQASHHVDMLQWLLGPAQSVSGIAARLGRKIETEDTAISLITFKNGALGIIEATTLTHPRNLEGSITIQGEKGTVKVGGTALNKIDIWEFKDNDPDDENIKNIGTNPPNVYGFGHSEVYKNVRDCLLRNGKNHVNGEEGYKTLELIMAIHKASREGKQVTIPLGEEEGVHLNRF
ncbi:MAG: Gfo/Idh/MocA family oxidoreductase [Nanoarchaeota archaeon]